MWIRGACAISGAIVLFACSEPSKTSERKALSHVERLAKLADEDVEELRRGMPRGGKSLGQIWEGKADPHADAGSVRRALDRVRGDDRDLEIAKGTFFAVTDDKAVVLASDQEPDVLAGKSLLASFPAIEKTLAGQLLEVRGTMAEMAGARTGGDEQWLIAAPVRDAKAAVRGAYVSGWSFRRFAYHLEETLKHDLVSEALRAGESRTKQPLVYVFVFAGPKVYGAPVTPLLDSQMLEKLDLPGKTANAVAFHQQLEITGRGYGLAAARTPKMGEDVGVVVLRSEI